ncbi:MAG TPA: hypothetical protein VGO59_17965 [Verrucomicrobiae bacterium]
MTETSPQRAPCAVDVQSPLARHCCDKRGPDADLPFSLALRGSQPEQHKHLQGYALAIGQGPHLFGFPAPNIDAPPVG